MKTQFHLIINHTGSIRTTKNRPSLDWSEIAVLVNLELPDALFKKPSLSANITIPPEAAIQSPIAADVQNNVKEAIQAVLGTEVKITLMPTPDDNSK